MMKPKFVYFLRICIVIISFVFISSCSKQYESSDFIFTAPAGYETNVYEPPQLDSNTNSELLLFSNIGHYPYFSIYRQEIPPGSDLETVFILYSSKISETASSYQFISKNMISINDRTAIEYLYCEYLGEPYVQSREIWIEYNDWTYSLVCVHPGNAPCVEIPVSQRCIQLAEDFQFK